MINIWFILLFSIVSTAQADEGMVYKPVIMPIVDVKKNPLFKLPFHETDFDLAYKTFVMNGNVEDAYAVASNAIRHKKNDLIWRQRLAQTALWTNHVDDALEQYIYLINVKDQEQFLLPALKITTQLHLYDTLVPLLEYKLKKHPEDKKTMLELADAYDQLGEPLLSIAFLNKINSKHPDSKYIENIIHIDDELGDFQAEISAIKNLQYLYGITAKNALELAAIKYDQADPESALHELNKTPHQETITNPEFWSTTASLAWIVGDDNLGRKAHLQLYHLNLLDEEGFRRLLLLEPPNALSSKIQIGLDAWRRYHGVDFFLDTLSLLLQTGDLVRLQKLYESPMPPDSLKTVSAQPDYWSGQVLLLESAGYESAARILLLKAAIAHPDNDPIQLLYLDFLGTQYGLFLPQQNVAYLFTAMLFLQHRASINDDWANVYVKNFLLLDKPNYALQVFANEAPELPHLPEWFIRYTDILEELNFQKSAHQVRLPMWSTMNAALKDHALDDDVFWKKYNELAAVFAPAQIAYPLSSYLVEYDASHSSADALMTWAISHNDFELTEALAHFYYPHGLPAWAALRIAILRNDQVSIRKMLDTMPEALPRKDRVAAAQQIGDIALAKHFSYLGMSQIQDAERYKLFTDAWLQTADQVAISSEFEQFGAMQGPREIISAKLFITDSYSITPYTSLWDARTNKIENLASRSYVEKITGVTLTRKTNRSTISLDVEDHQALYNSYNAELSIDYLLTSKLTLSGKAGYNRRSTLDVFMVAGGSQDELITTASYDMTVRDKVIGSIELNNYYLQDRTALGGGQVYFGEYDHKLWLDYPDYTLQLFGSINRYHTLNSLLQGRILNIFPAGITPLPASLTSTNFWETGVNFIFGDELREGYTHDWRPYASVGYEYSSTSGYGPLIDIGITGSVFGRDKLAFYYKFSSSNAGKSQVDFLFGLRYVMFF